MSKTCKNFKVGDKVRCIDNSHLEDLTKDRIYTILNSENGYVYIENDENFNSHYFDYRFVLAEKNTKKPHKHAEVIKAWADGAKVQFKSTYTNEWRDCDIPLWGDNAEYRIKPEVKPDIVRYATLYSTVAEHNYWFDDKTASSNVKATWKHDGEKYVLHSLEII